ATLAAGLVVLPFVIRWAEQPEADAGEKPPEVKRAEKRPEARPDVKPAEPRAPNPDVKPAEPRAPNPDVKPATARPDPGDLRGWEGAVGSEPLFRVTGRTDGSIYGTDVYTSDSKLATAAVHAGVLRAGETG